jgi:hypothetical protein
MAAAYSPRSAEWIGSHPQFARDDRKRAKALAAHNDAVAEGIEPDSQRYFDHIEKFVGLRDAGAADNHPRRRDASENEEAGEPRVTVIKRGERPVPERLELKANEPVRWTGPIRGGKDEER